jgi:hypothetical protein
MKAPKEKARWVPNPTGPGKEGAKFCTATILEKSTSSSIEEILTFLDLLHPEGDEFPCQSAVRPPTELWAKDGNEFIGNVTTFGETLESRGFPGQES